MKEKRRRFAAKRGDKAAPSFRSPYGRMNPTVYTGGIVPPGITNVGSDLLYSDTDPNGSYTGLTRIEGEVPVQDVDDL